MQSNDITQVLDSVKPDEFQQKMVDAVKSNFMTIQVSVSQWDGRVSDPKLAKLVEGAGIKDAKASKVSTRFAVYGGASLHEFDKVLRAKFTEFREHLYANSVSFADPGQTQKVGARLVPVTKVVTLKAELDKLKTEAEEALESFLANYDQHLASSKIALGMDVFNRLSNSRDKLGRSRIPSADDLRSRFRAAVQTPQPLAIHSVDDIKRIMPKDSPDLGFAMDVATASFSKLKGQLETAIDESMDDVHKALTTVNERLASVAEGKGRLSDSLVRNVVASVEQAEGMSALPCFGPDFGDVLRDIKAKVANVQQAGQWRDNVSKRREAQSASEKLAKQIEDLKARSKATMQQVAPSTSDSWDDLDIEEY